MKGYRIELPALSDSEINQVERFLAKDTLRNRSSIRKFLHELANEVRSDNVVTRGAHIRIDDEKFGLIVSERWLLMIKGPMFGRSQWRPWAPIRLEVHAEVMEMAKNVRLRPKIEFSIADHYLNLLLVRAIANEQIRNFIECAFCGNVKHVRIVRQNVRFCGPDHRARFHYLISRQGAKDLLKERRKWRSRGIPCSVQDILILRDRGIKEGTRAARNFLARASLPLQGMDTAELEALRKEYA